MYSIIKFEKGDNYVRFLSIPYRYNAHLVLGERIKCTYSAIGECKFCEFALKDRINKPYRLVAKFFAPAYSYNNKQVHLMNFGHHVFNQIANFAKNIEYGDPCNYDLNIEKNDITSSSYEIYKVKVITHPNTLTLDELKSLKGFLNKALLERLCIPDDRDIERSFKLARAINILG